MSRNVAGVQQASSRERKYRLEEIEVEGFHPSDNEVSEERPTKQKVEWETLKDQNDIVLYECPKKQSLMFSFENINFSVLV